MKMNPYIYKVSIINYTSETKLSYVHVLLVYLQTGTPKNQKCEKCEHTFPKTIC
jgi:hypothetical protein